MRILVNGFGRGLLAIISLLIFGLQCAGLEACALKAWLDQKFLEIAAVVIVKG